MAQWAGWLNVSWRPRQTLFNLCAHTEGKDSKPSSKIKRNAGSQLGTLGATRLFIKLPVTLGSFS